MSASLYTNLPAELRLLPNWVLWRLEYPNGPDKKASKVPYSIKGYKASTMNAEHWSTFDECFNILQIGGYDGLGFVFTNTDYSGIDLDDARFFHTGEPNPNYQADLNRQIKIAHEFDSYSELSPSGTGLHIIVKGKVPDGKRTNFIELYPSGRFFTMTGQVHNNKPIAECNELLNLLWAQMGGVLNNSTPIFAEGIETNTDNEILELAAKHNGSIFENLANGNFSGYPSQSEADQAYLNIIAYYTNSKAQVERIFRASKLMRSKVNVNKGYLPRSIEKAFDQKVPALDFDKLREELNGVVAQRLEPVAHNGPVAGSNPASPTTKGTSYNGNTPAFEAVDVGSIPAVPTITLPPGLMGEIAQFVYAYSTRPVPEVSLAAAIGLMAGICGRAYNVSNTGLNQYVLLLAMTGAGKEAMAEGIDRLMSEIRMQVPTSSSFIGPGEISSGSALYKYLANTSQSFVSILGEFGLRIRQLSSPNANGAEISLRRMILDLFTKSGHNRVLPASAYSKKEDSSNAIPSPAFSLLGESTPERFYEVLNEEMISEGLLPRFLLIEYKGGRVPKNTNKSNVTPTIGLIEKLAALAAHADSVNHANPRKVINVQQTHEAEIFLSEWDKYADNKINTVEKDVLRQLWNRADLKALKLAALVAVGENFFMPTISLECAQWAVNLVKNDIATLTAKFEAGEIGGNTFELNQYKDMIRVIRDYKAKDFAYVSKYQAVESMHKAKIINNTYIMLRLSKMASFRNDKAGATAALKRTIQTMVDHGKLMPVASAVLVEKHHTSQKAFYILSPIDDE